MGVGCIMGDRYYLHLKCPHCGHIEDEDYYYAPTSGFLTHKCEACGKIIDLEKLSGIDAESTANTEHGVKAVEEFKKGFKKEVRRKNDKNTTIIFINPLLSNLKEKES